MRRARERHRVGRLRHRRIGVQDGKRAPQRAAYSLEHLRCRRKPRSQLERRQRDQGNYGEQHSVEPSGADGANSDQ